MAAYKVQVAGTEFQKRITGLPLIGGSAVYSSLIPGVDLETLRSLTDLFKANYSSGVAILATVIDDKPSIVVSSSDNLVKSGLNAGEIARAAAQIVGGSGGGRPNLAQAGGKDATRLAEALEIAENLVKSKLVK